MKTTYTTATAFRQALEARLAKIAQRDDIDIQRLRRQVAFDRLLCRLFRDSHAPWIPTLLTGTVPSLLVVV